MNLIDSFLQFETIPLDSPAPMLILWVITFVFCFVLLNEKLITRKMGIVIYLVTFLVGGILFGGIPNVVLPIQETLSTIGERGDLSAVLHPVAILFFILFLSSFVGRIFCGFVCPIGTLQELISKINFKSDIKGYNKNKFHFEVSTKHTNRIRFIFLIILFSLAFVGYDLLIVFNPLSGFLFFKTLILSIPFIALVVVCIASIFYYRPWCRFFCPFSIGSSLISRYSGLKYKRTEACTDCGLCEKICPTQEAYRVSKRSECYYCNRCIEVCAFDAIEFDFG